jgi:hypothetical protein
MTTRKGSRMTAEHDCADDDHFSTCPRCQLRAKLAEALLRNVARERQEMLDELLDAVESLWAIGAAGCCDDRECAADDAASALIDVAESLHRIADGGAPRRRD